MRSSWKPEQRCLKAGPWLSAVGLRVAGGGQGSGFEPVCCCCCFRQGYQWLKDKILSEEGRRQQAKLKELQAIAERLGCTLPQLAIGTTTLCRSLSFCLSVRPLCRTLAPVTDRCVCV